MALLFQLEWPNASCVFTKTSLLVLVLPGGGEVGGQSPSPDVTAVTSFCHPAVSRIGVQSSPPPAADSGLSGWLWLVLSQRWGSVPFILLQLPALRLSFDHIFLSSGAKAPWGQQG